MNDSPDGEAAHSSDQERRTDESELLESALQATTEAQEARDDAAEASQEAVQAEGEAEQAREGGRTGSGWCRASP